MTFSSSIFLNNEKASNYFLIKMSHSSECLCYLHKPLLFPFNLNKLLTYCYSCSVMNYFYNYSSGEGKFDIIALNISLHD